jgi:hypothetical protein
MHVEIAEMLEKTGDLAGAEEKLRATVRWSQDPDLVREWLRVLAASGRREEVQAELSRPSTEGAKDPDAVVLLLAMLHETVPAETWFATANLAWPGLCDQGNFAQAAGVLLLMADHVAEQKNFAAATLIARIAGSKPREAANDSKSLLSYERLQATALLREASFLAACEVPWRAGSNLKHLADLPPGLARGFEERRRAVEEAARLGTEADLERRREGFEFPADVTLAGALERAAGIDVKRDGAFAQLRLPDGREWTVRADLPNSAGRFDPFRRCLRFEEVVAAPDVALLFPEGDLFLGRDALLGDGLYLSPARPAALEPCRFGLPFDRANSITDAASFSEQPDGSFNVALGFPGGYGFVGGAMRDGDRWLPLGHCLLTLPDWSLYVGKTFEERPVDGARLLVDGSAEFWADGKLVEVVTRDDDFANDRFEVRMRDGDSIEYFDRRTGIRLEWDNITLFSSGVDTARLAAWQQSEEQRREREAVAARWAAEERERKRQREEEMAAHQRWIDEQNARIRAERIAQGLPPDVEETPSRSRIEAFNFHDTLNGGGPSDLCVRCKGAGENYVWGDVKQQVVWRNAGATPGGWVDATIHTSGHMEMCTLCDGTGIRWGAQQR